MVKKLPVLLSLFVALTLLAVLTAGSLYFYQLNKGAREKVELRAAIFLESLDEELANLTITGKALARAATEVGALKECLKEPSVENLGAANEVLDSFSDTIPGSICLLIDSNGRVVTSSNRFQQTGFIGKVIDHVPWVTGAVKGKTVVFPGEEPMSGFRGIFFSAPVTGVVGKGLLVMLVPVSELEETSVSGIRPNWILTTDKGAVFAANDRRFYGGILDFSQEKANQLNDSHRFNTSAWRELVLPKKTMQNLLLTIEARSFPNWNFYLWLDMEENVADYRSPFLLEMPFYVAIFYLIVLVLLFWLYYVTNRNIRSRMRYERKLAAGEHKYRKAVENAGVSLYLLDSEGKIEYVNRAGISLSGRLKEEFKKGKYLNDFVEDNSLNSVSNRYEKAKKSLEGPGDSIEFTFLDKKGNRKECMGFFGVSGNEEYSLSLMDVTSRKQTEEKLSERCYYFRSVLDSVPVGIMTLDEETKRVTDVNPFASTLIGLIKKMIVGRPSTDFFCTAEEIELLSNDKHEFLEKDWKNDRGEQYHLRIYISEPFSDNETHLILTILDMTAINIMLRAWREEERLAEMLLESVIGKPPRHVEMHDGLSLFFDFITQAGGNARSCHHFIKTMDVGAGQARTVFSFKQHADNRPGVLMKELLLDQVHTSYLNDFPKSKISDGIAYLNNRVELSEMFEAQDSLALITGAVDHESGIFSYCRAGKPKMVLVREGKVIPVDEGAGRELPRPAEESPTWKDHELQLKEGDRLILFSGGSRDMLPQHKGSTATLNHLVKDILRENSDLSASLIVRKLIDKMKFADTDLTLEQDAAFFCLEVENDNLKKSHTYYPSTREEAEKISECVLDEIKSVWESNGFHDPEKRVKPILDECLNRAWLKVDKEGDFSQLKTGWRCRNDFCLEITFSVDNEQFQEITATSGLMMTSRFCEYADEAVIDRRNCSIRLFFKR